MISIKAIRENPINIKERLRSKNDNTDIDYILDLDSKLRNLKTKSNDLRSERNSASQKIATAKSAGKNSTKIINETRILGDHLKKVENELNVFKKELSKALLSIPNTPHSSVPKGKDESQNILVREWGHKPDFSFTPKTHMALGESLKLFDFKRGAKLSGSGFPLYTGMGAKLERSLINFMLDHHSLEYGFEEVFPSVLMTKDSMETTGQLPKFQEDMYHTEIDNLYLAPTAEVPITNIHRDEIIKDSDLPIKYVGYSPCFRRESGSYGKDTRGLLRVHQFNKVELVKFTKPEDSYNELEKLTLQAESILQKLGLHYRVIELCTGDLSFAAAKCYDIEIWAPGEGKWLEVSSCSNFETFQAQRGKIRYRSSENSKVDFLHTLNGSGVATPRLMVALLETYQKKDGTVNFPSSIEDLLGINKLS